MTEKTTQLKKDEKTPAEKKKAPAAGGVWQSLQIPALAVLTGLIIGAIIIIITNEKAATAYGNFFSDPLAALAASWNAVATAYGALLIGSLGDPVKLFEGLTYLFSTGDASKFIRALYPLSESLVASTPYIFAGLSVALGFRAGLFNIGAEGQLFIGTLTSVYVGYSIVGLPWFIHLPLAILAGALGGAIWAAIPGYLKAKAGAHEVVNTIMMNWIAFRLSDWLLNGPMKAPGYRPITPQIETSAELPRFFADPLRLNWGFVLALVAAYFVYWLLFKTTIGFEIRSVGTNPDAARYAGVNIVRNIVLVMAISGALSGLAGAAHVLGVDRWVGQGFSAGYGYDAIALALLGNSHPLGVVLAALLFGTLRSGATRMQSMAGIPIDIISIIQGLVIIFVAAPAIVRWLYRLRNVKTDTAVMVRGWGK